MTKKSNTKIKVLITAAVTAILIYVLVMFISANFSMVHTEAAAAASASNTIYTTGYIIRNETYITNDTGGVVAYEIANGDSVSANGVIAKIYSSEADAANQKKVLKLTQEIDKLKKLNSTTEQFRGTSIESIDSTLSKNLKSLMNNLNNNNYLQLEQLRNDILYNINERQVLTGAVTDFNERLTALEAEKNELQSKISAPIAEIRSPVAGYFVDFTDGYENSFDYTKAEGLSYAQLENLQNKEPQEVPANVIGKVISNLNWYISCPVTAQQALEFNDISEDVKVKMPFASTERVAVNVVAVNQDSKTDNAVIVLECKDMSEELANLRNETVQIDVATYTGIKIPKSALHDDTVIKAIENDDGTTTTDSAKVQGVYVLYSGELVFKQVDVIYSDEDFVICNQEPEEGKLFNGETVQLYDKIVVEGSDLYAGKIVKQSS